KKEKLGEIETNCPSIDSLFFVRKGQNLVAINHTAGLIAILSLASLSLRTLSTSPAPISAACHDSGHIASYCCSTGVVYQVSFSTLPSSPSLPFSSLLLSFF